MSSRSDDTVMVPSGCGDPPGLDVAAGDDGSMRLLSNGNGQAVRFAALEVDFSKRELRRDSKLLNVEPKVFDLLHYLMHHRDRIVRKGELLDALWPDLDTSEASLASCVVRLRRALGDRNGQFIKTHYGKGYRFIADCETATPSVAKAAASEPIIAAPTFIGRDDELRRLEIRLQAARGGSGSILLLAGEQGIGKTRLVEEMRARFTVAPLITLVGRCYEGEGTPPFWPWVQILREFVARADNRALRDLLASSGDAMLSLVPELGVKSRRIGPKAAPSDGADARFQLFRSVSAFLGEAAQRAPLLLIIEDLHWADVPSLSLLRSLAHEIGRMAVLLVVTYRDTEVREQPALADTLATLLVSPACAQSSLRGFECEDVVGLVQSLAPQVDAQRIGARLVGETAGNPFFIEQVLRHLLESDQLGAGSEPEWERLGIPEGIQIVIERRLSRLSRGCRHLLAIAATVGREFDASMVNRARAAELGQSPLQSYEEMQLELEEAAAARILAPPSLASDSYHFTHALLRDVVYRGQGVAERSRRHRRIAETLESEFSAGMYPNVAQVAEHYILGAASGGVGKAIQWAISAGDAAAVQFAFETAAQRYRQAVSLLRLLETRDPDQEGSLLVALAQAQWSCGDAAAARVTAEQAGALARLQRDPELLARAALACGSRIVAQADTDQRFAAVLEEARAALPEDDSVLRAKLLGRLAWAHYYAPDHGRQREQLSGEAVAMARRLGDPQALLWSLCERHRSLTAPDRSHERLALANEIVALAEGCASFELLALGYQQQARDLLELGERAAADAAMQRLSHLPRDLHSTLKWSQMLWETMSAMLDGRWTESDRLRQATFDFGRPIDEPFATLTAGTQYLTQQYTQGTADGLAERIRLLSTLYPHLTAARAALTYVCLVQGDLGEARIEADRCLVHGIDALPWDTTWLPTVGFLGAVYAELADRARCDELLAALTPYHDHVGVLGINASVCYGAIARPIAALYAAQRRWIESDASFESATATNRRIGANPWLAYTLYEHARMLQRRGRQRDALRIGALLKEARSLAAELGIATLTHAIRMLTR